MKNLYDSEYLKILLLKNENIIFYTWKKTTENIEAEEFKKECRVLMKNTVETKVNLILGDLRNFKYPIIPTIQEWIAKELFPFFNKNLTKFAQIKSEEFITQLSIEQLYEEDKSKHYQKQYFSNEDEAKKWLIE